jgi:hypothetical protein
MRVLISNKHEVLVDILGQGAVGTVYQHPSNRRLAVKIYEKREDCEEVCINWLCLNPPADLWQNGQPTFAWPIEPVRDPMTGEMIGFVMPKVEGAVELQAVVDPCSRRIKVSYAWLMKVAISLLTRVHTLHLMKYIVGDLNFRNILVSRRGIVTLIDVDSFHFVIPRNGPTFSPTVCRPELQPPELVAAALPILDRDDDQDAFSALIVVYRLLCEGVHPFDCQYLGAGDPLPHHEMILQAIWPDSLKHPLHRPKPCTFPLSSLPSSFQILVRRMFDDGIIDRVKRPNVTELLTCLMQHSPMGLSVRAYIRRRAWNQQLTDGRSIKQLLVNGASLTKQHKTKLSLAAVALYGILGAGHLILEHFKDDPSHIQQTALAHAPSSVSDQDFKQSVDGAGRLPTSLHVTGELPDSISHPALVTDRAASLHDKSYAVAAGRTDGLQDASSLSPQSKSLVDVDARGASNNPVSPTDSTLAYGDRHAVVRNVVVRRWDVVRVTTATGATIYVKAVIKWVPGEGGSGEWLSNETTVAPGEHIVGTAIEQ